jgi:hypothetical protein
VVKTIKSKVRHLPCLSLPDPSAIKIVETDASDKGYRGIHKHQNSGKEHLIAFASKHWNIYQQNYPTMKKEILAIVLCISKFQADLLNRNFLLRIDCEAAKSVLQKDVQNLASKHIFARWQAILSIFNLIWNIIKGV